jgi:hypothetical protein
MIEFPCWSCAKLLKAKSEYSGRKCKCTKCGQSNSIPGDLHQEIEPPSEVEYEAVQVDEIPPVTLVRRPTVRAPMDIVGWIRVFLGFTAVLFTLGLAFLLSIIVGKEEHFLQTGMDRWTAFGYYIGCWFGIMISLAAVFLLSEIVLAVREMRRANT